MFAILTVGSAGVVVLARSLIYSAFALLFTFFGVAGLYVLLGADFLAAAQLLVYVGGITVLLLFGVMLTHRIYDLDLRTEKTQLCRGRSWRWGCSPSSAAVAFKTHWPTAARPPGAHHPRDRADVPRRVPAAPSRPLPSCSWWPSSGRR